jgi:hypothetical protein
MGLNFDITAATPILKNRYTDKKIETLAFSSPTLAKFPKKTDGGGLQYVGAIRNAVTSAVSASDTIAFTTGSASVYQQWQCPWKYAYASGNLTGAAIDQANGDMDSLVESMTSEFDGMFIALGIHAGAALFGNGGGAIGQLNGGAVAALTVTLLNPSLIVNFYVGQLIQASFDDGTGGGGTRSAGATQTLTGVDVNLGTLTAASNWSTAIAAIGVSDFLFNQGDYNAKFAGLAGWIPDTAHRANLNVAFNNVVRSTDPVRLAGVAYNGKGAPKSETFIQTAALVGRMGGKPDLLVTNPLDYADVVKELSTRVIYTTEQAFANPDIGFPGVKVATQYGNITIVADPFCPQGNAWLLTTATWLLISMGKLPKVLGAGIDGQEWLRNAGADSYQLRGAYRATTYCTAPGHNGSMLF